MSVTSQICKRIYSGDGETRSWEVDFPIQSAADVAVYVTTSGGAETKITSGYEVDLVNEVVVYPTLASGLSPLPAGAKITLLRTTALTQELTLTQQGVLDADALEAGYDKLTLQLQELAEKIERCIKYAVSSGKTGADAQQFLNELNSQQTAALNTALSSVAQTETEVLQALQTETTNRQEADLALQQSVQTLSGTLSQKDAAQTQALSAEAAARAGACDTLQAAVNAEITARQTADDAKLSKTEAADTYLTQSAAAATYLTQTQAGSTYVALSQKAAANGVATLDSNTLIPAAQLPIIDGGNANA